MPLTSNKSFKFLENEQQQFFKKTNGAYILKEAYRPPSITEENNHSPPFSFLGCEVEILGVRPTYCLEYKTSPTDINFANAVSDALDSLK